MATTNKQDILTFFGRITFTPLFIIAGIDKIINFNPTLQSMTNHGVKAAIFFLILAIIMELGGGLMVLLGFFSRLGALLLFLFIIPVTYVFHSFWTYDPAMVANQMHHFLKNISILGGALYILAFGAGRWSINKH